MRDIILPSLSNLLVQTPVLLVYLIATVLALMFWRRSPSTGILVLLGAGLLLFVGVLWPFAFQYAIVMRGELGWEHENLGVALQVLGLISSLARAVGVGLLVAAAFVGRRASANGPSKPDAAKL